MFSSKTVLLLCVQTFSYDIAVKMALEQKGARVIHFDERPSNSNLSKGLIRLRRSLYREKILHHFEKILNTTKGKQIDYLFLIKGEVTPPSFLKQFKQAHPDCELIFYTWDSFSNNPNSLSILPFFDKKFTFDSEDSKKYAIRFRPLFFIDSYERLKPIKDCKIDFDISFTGTAHSDRYKVANEVKKWCDKNGLRGYFFYYQHGIIVDLFKRAFDRAYSGVPFKRLSFKSLSASELMELYERSSVILDIQHPKQTGLTMRVFEALGASKKVITTNRSIEGYTFFNSANILVIDRDHVAIDKDFVTSEFENLDSSTRKAMSISGWIEEIFSPDQNGHKWLS